MHRKSILFAGVAVIALGFSFIDSAHATSRGGNDDRPTTIVNAPVAHGGQGGRGGDANQAQIQIQGQHQSLEANQEQRTNVRVRTTNVAEGGRARARASTGPVTVGPQDVRVTVGGDYVQYERGGRQVGALYGGSAIPPQCGFAFNAGGANQNGSGLLGFSFETESCRKDRLANRLAALGNATAGIALLCTMSEIRDSMAAAGTPCPGTQQPAPAMASVAAPAQQVVAAAPVAANSNVRPDWCFTRDREVLRRPECRAG